MNVTIHVEGKLVWRYGRTPNGYVAICDPISQTVQAERFSDLLATMNEALDSTFRELLSSGDLEKFLKEQGWSSKLPASTERRKLRFDMPFELKGIRRNDLKEALC